MPAGWPSGGRWCHADKRRHIRAGRVTSVGEHRRAAKKPRLGGWSLLAKAASGRQTGSSSGPHCGQQRTAFALLQSPERPEIACRQIARP